MKKEKETPAAAAPAHRKGAEPMPGTWIEETADGLFTVIVYGFLKPRGDFETLARQAQAATADEAVRLLIAMMGQRMEGYQERFARHGREAGEAMMAAHGAHCLRDHGTALEQLEKAREATIDRRAVERIALYHGVAL